MKDKAFVGASLLAAVVASFCCILPLVLAVGGFAVIGASAFFASLRPYLLAATFGLLAVGFYSPIASPSLPVNLGQPASIQRQIGRGGSGSGPQPFWSFFSPLSLIIRRQSQGCYCRSEKRKPPRRNRPPSAMSALRWREWLARFAPKAWNTN